MSWVLRFYWLVPVWVFADLALKSWASQIFGGTQTIVPGIFKIWVVRNHGAFLGLFEGQAAGHIIALLLPLIAMGCVIGLAVGTDRRRGMRHVGFACMIGGACGNLVDRIMHGYVLDFLQVGGLPVFNLADLAILVGLVLAIVDYSRPVPRKDLDVSRTL